MASYHAAIQGLAPAAAATDIFAIGGSATNDIGIVRIVISGTATSASTTDFLLIKRSTADTGGTSTSPTIVPNDSSIAAATATVKAYTANPTLGTAVGTMKAEKAALPPAAAPGFSAPPIVFDFSNEPPILHGTAEQICVNLNGATLTGGSLNIWVELMEI